MHLSIPRYASAIAGAYALLGGLVSFVGWAAGIYRLTDWDGSGISIKANAALSVAAAGAALLTVALYPSARWATRTLGLFVAAVGGLTLFEHLSGWDLGIDTLLFDEPAGALATAAPGRMGPPGATSFLLIGTALVLSTRDSRSRSVSVGLSVAVLAIGMLSLTGHWYDAELMYTVPRLTGIAMQTASMITALGIGLVAAVTDRQPMRTLCEDSNAGMLARRLLPLIVFVPLALGWLHLNGQQAGLYDASFGTAIATTFEVALLAGLLWWSVRTIRTREIKQMQAEEALKEADRRKDEFLATLAHELRNPLAPIRQAAEIARMPSVTPDQLRWSQEVIKRQVHNMSRLLDDLLDISRITRGTLDVRKAPIDLYSIVDAAVEIARPAIDARGHSLSIDLPKSRVGLYADSLRLSQVVANLLTNAAKYSDPQAQIRLTARQEGSEVILSVSDTGIGISADMLSKIFEMFVQAKSALDRTEDGLGIGLSLAKGLVELHGGSMEARSAGLGQGSEFIVRLPLV